MNLKLARDETGAPEIFRSIQGEGRNAGRVRTFVRLAGCNLHCVWCDTAYTWNWTDTDFPHERDRPGAPHKFDIKAEVATLSVEEVCAAAGDLPAEGVVITGGEPLMQRRGLEALARALKSAGFLVEIETNGSIAPGEALAATVDLFMVSPKLAHSGNDPAVALNSDALAAFAALETAAFKFVAKTPADVEEAARLAADFGLAPERVYVMPEGTDAETLDARGRALIEATLARGFNYTDRLHVRLFGARRGV